MMELLEESGDKKLDSQLKNFSFGRNDLTELYRIIMNRYGVNGPEDDLEKIKSFKEENQMKIATNCGNGWRSKLVLGSNGDKRNYTWCESFGSKESTRDNLKNCSSRIIYGVLFQHPQMLKWMPDLKKLKFTVEDQVREVVGEIDCKRPITGSITVKLSVLVSSGQY
ncbi:hypothetical protein Tco_0863551 [Tanacetum coccineum]